MARRYRDEDWLRDRYHGNGWTQAEIAAECGVSPRCIRTWMQNYDIETRTPAGENHGLHGEPRDEETRAKISETMQGREVSTETREQMAESHRGIEVEPETREKISDALTGIERSAETRRKMSEATAGDSNPNWSGGYSRRYGSGWSTARDAVRERDEVCQYCGRDGSEHRLEVHHIVPVRVFRETDGVSISSAHVLENLVLLCKPCHARADHGTIEFSVAESALPDPIGEIYK